jgi:hypothetical protein
MKLTPIFHGCARRENSFQVGQRKHHKRRHHDVKRSPWSGARTQPHQIHAGLVEIHLDRTVQSYIEKERRGSMSLPPNFRARQFPSLQIRSKPPPCNRKTQHRRMSRLRGFPPVGESGHLDRLVVVLRIGLYTQNRQPSNPPSPLPAPRMPGLWWFPPIRFSGNGRRLHSPRFGGRA